MAGYDEDFWGEDFFEEEEGATEGEETEVETEETADTEGTEGTEGAEVDIDGEDAGGEGGEGEDEGFSPDLLARIEAETQKRVDARIAREFEGILNPYTNQPIRTEADLTAYRSAFAAEEQRQQLEEMYHQMVVMGGLCQQAIAVAVKTLEEEEDTAENLEAQVFALDGEIDDMERECLKSHNIHLVIHYDPVVTDDPELTRLHILVDELLGEMDARLKTHDFRMVPGGGHTNLIFDIAVPQDTKFTKSEIQNKLEEALRAREGKTYHTIITFDPLAFNQESCEHQ